MSKVIVIDLPVPRIGAKIWLLDDSGTFSLERGPGVIRTDACTHAGAGSVTMIDGVPDDEGFFDEKRQLAEADMAEFVRDIMRADDTVTEEDARARVRKSAYNGRPIYYANPTVMGSWMMDGGFYFGLTLVVPGGHEGQAPIASIVWMPRVRHASK